MKQETKAKIKRSLFNFCVCIVCISGLSMLSAYITKTIGLLELSNLLAVGSLLGAIAGVTFGLIVWLVPEWYGIKKETELERFHRKMEEKSKEVV